MSKLDSALAIQLEKLNELRERYGAAFLTSQIRLAETYSHLADCSVDNAAKYERGLDKAMFVYANALKTLWNLTDRSEFQFEAVTIEQGLDRVTMQLLNFREQQQFYSRFI